MITFICLLRGINVGGKRLVKMETLRALFAAAGAQNVRTYIQSGNVVFEMAGNSLPASFEAEILQKTENSFGFSVPLLFIKSADLRRLSDANPYLENATAVPDFFHLTLFKGPVSEEVITRYKKASLPEAEAILHSECAYLCCPDGYQNFKGTNTFWEKITGTQATTRNWKTVQKLVAMSETV